MPFVFVYRRRDFGRAIFVLHEHFVNGLGDLFQLPELNASAGRGLGGYQNRVTVVALDEAQVHDGLANVVNQTCVDQKRELLMTRSF